MAAYPTRFREAEARGIRLGRPLKLVGRVGKVDETLMHSIGAAFMRCDATGAALATAMRLPNHDLAKVSMTDFATALSDGIDNVVDAPPALRAFFADVDKVPSWVDWDLLAHGQRVYHRFGQNAADVLLQLSLIGGYRFGGPTDLLVATGGLTGDMTVRRLGETQKWATSLSVPGGLARDGEAWRLTVHVRAMHALVNETFRPRWDVERWGLPINQADQAATLGLFDAVVLLGARALGVPVSAQESRAVMHLWKYVGWLMGVDEEFLVDTERERHRINYHLLLAQADISEAGPLALPIHRGGPDRAALRERGEAPRHVRARTPAQHAHPLPRAAEHARARPAAAPALGARLRRRAEHLALPHALGSPAARSVGAHRPRPRAAPLLRW